MTRFLFLTCLLLVSRCGLAGQIDRELWASAEIVEIADTVRQDAFLLAGEARLPGTFIGDLWVFARRILFTGRAEDDVRAFAMEVVKVDAPIVGSLRAAAWGGNLVTGPATVVHRDAMILAGRMATVEGRFESDVLIQAPVIRFGGEVLGSVTLISPEIELLNGAKIHGDLVVRGSRELVVPDGVTILGTVRYEDAVTSELEEAFRRARWTLLSVQFITAFLVGLFMLRVLPRFTARSVEVVVRHRGPSTGAGFGSLLLLGLSGWMLLPTVLGTGIGIFLLLVAGLLFYCGKIIGALAIGALLLRCSRPCGFWRVVSGLLIGLALLYSAFSIPFLGPMLYLLVSASGMGSMLLCIRHSQRMCCPSHLSSSESHPIPNP